MTNNKKLIVCDQLFNKDGSYITSKYCASIFITSTYFGAFLENTDNLIFDKHDKTSVRSGTVTFIEHNDELYAVTCKHVIDSLEKRQALSREKSIEECGFASPEDGIGLFTLKGKTHFHLNYYFTIVPLNSNGEQPDVAIARIKHNSMTRLGREAILLSNRIKLPETGVASGYPEPQRAVKVGRKINKLTPKFTTCIATIQLSNSGKLYLDDAIDNHNNVDSLSGMSGGPILWSDDNNFGLAGIIYEGNDIQPIKGGFDNSNRIFVKGERVTIEIFENWIKAIPPIFEIKDQTKYLIIK